jgi:hypothetical protein
MIRVGKTASRHKMRLADEKVNLLLALAARLLLGLRDKRQESVA